MIHKGYLLHLTVTDTLMDNKDNVGNKIAILSGDYFISKACLGLAHLQNTYVSVCVRAYMYGCVDARMCCALCAVCVHACACVCICVSQCVTVRFNPIICILT